MKPKDLLDLVFKRWEFFLTSWAFFVTVTLGLFGLVASNPSIRQSCSLRVLLACAFFLFALSHLSGLYFITRQWKALATAAKNSINSLSTMTCVTKFNITKVLDPPHFCLIFVFHVILDAIMITGLLKLR